MKQRLQLRTRQRQLITWKKAMVTFSLTATIGGGATWMILQLGHSNDAAASEGIKQKFDKGSVIIRMEDATKHPETIGLIQDLVQNSLVPIEWVKSTGSTKNDLSSEALIIRKSFLSPLILSKLDQWSQKGLLIGSLENATTWNSVRTINWFPKWTMDSSANERVRWSTFLASTGLPSYCINWGKPVDSTKWEFQPCSKWSNAKSITSEILLMGLLEQCTNTPWTGRIVGSESLVAGMKTTLRVEPAWAKNGWTIQWTSSIGGTFDRPMSLNTTYLAPIHYQQDTMDIIRIRATSPEGWTAFAALPIRIARLSTGPVTVSSFTIHPNKGNVLLKWSTASETDNDFFSIERSEDGVNWKSIGNQPGAGNSQAFNHYHFSDNQPIQGRSYYRLGQTSFDGSRSYYQILSIDNYRDNDASEVLQVDDAVFESSLSFKIESASTGEGQLSIYSPSGELKDMKKYILNKGKQVLFYDQKGLDGGVYIAVFQDNEGKVSSTRIVKI